MELDNKCQKCLELNPDLSKRNLKTCVTCTIDCKKLCNVCHHSIDRSEFPKDRASCKPCFYAAQRVEYAKTHENMRKSIVKTEIGQECSICKQDLPLEKFEKRRGQCKVCKKKLDDERDAKKEKEPSPFVEGQLYECKTCRRKLTIEHYKIEKGHKLRKECQKCRRQ